METYFSVCTGAESTMYAQSTAGQEQKFKHCIRQRTDHNFQLPKCYPLSEQIIGIIINSSFNFCVSVKPNAMLVPITSKHAQQLYKGICVLCRRSVLKLLLYAYCTRRTLHCLLSPSVKSIHLPIHQSHLFISLTLIH